MKVDSGSFWQKVKSNIGDNTLIIKALTLFYVMCDEDVPVWVKGVCSTALIYFINPLDPLGPDPLMYADDIAIMAAALASLSKYIKARHTLQAKQKLNTLI